jgi:outer membrane receptor protein involved in Fe transport
VTGADGAFRFTDVASGTHALTVSLPGFSTERREVVVDGGMVHVPVRLSLAARVEHVTVTARKREELLADIGMAVSAVTGDTLERRGIETLEDLTRAVPGFTAAAGPWGIPVFTLRGLGNDDHQSPQQSPTVGVFLDEVALPYTILTRGAHLDVERVEVMKGPQGTLFGPGTTGGAVHYVARKPTRAFEADVDVEATSLGGQRLDARVSGPLGRTTSARVAVSTARGGAWQRSVTRGETLGDTGLTSLRGQVQWEPDSRLQARLAYLHWRDTGDPLAAQVLGPNVQNPASPLAALLAEVPPSATGARHADWPEGLAFGLDQRSHLLSASVEVRLPATMRLVSQTAYGAFTRNDVQPNGGTAIQNNDSDVRGTIELLSQELRLSGARPDLSWLVGGYVSTSEVYEHRLQFIGSNSISEIVPGVVDFDVFFTEGRQHTTATAGFGQVEWAAAREVTLRAGARQTSDRKRFDACSGDPGLGAGPAAFLNIALETTIFTPGECVSVDASLRPGRYRGTLDEHDLSGHVGIDWRPAPTRLVYGNVSRGFKSGSFPLLAANAQSQFAPVRGEHVLAYEGGVRSTLAGGAARVGGSLFYYDYTNKQIRGSVVDPVFNVLGRLVNVPVSTVRGAELELEAHATPTLRLALSGTWLDTRIVRFVGFDRQGDLRDFAGAAFPLSPPRQLVASARYERRLSTALTGHLGSDVTYAAATQGTADFARLPAYQIDATTLVDLEAGLDSATGHWRVTAWMRNATSQYYWVNAMRQGDFDLRWPGRPRTVGVSLGYSWR